MIFASSSNFLGLAVTDRAITCAELSIRAERRVVRRTATLLLDADQTFDKPAALGQALASFLRQHGFSASRAVVGVPAKWVIATEKDVPPASEEQVRAMLRLQSERMSLAESGDMVFDYVSARQSGQGGKVLLVAMLRKQLDRIEQTIDAAGLSVVAITPLSMALAAAGATQSPQSNSPVLVIARHGAEVVWNYQGAPRMLRHIAVPVANGHGLPAIAPLGAELKRAVAVTAVNGQGGGSEIILFDSVGLSEAQVSELSDRLGRPVRGGDGMARLGVTSAPNRPASSGDEHPSAYAPSAALAMLGARRELLPLDFAHSRLAPAPARRISRTMLWSGAAAAMILIGIGWLVVDVQLRRSELASIRRSMSSGTESVRQAENLADRVRYTSGFFRTRTPMLEALREVTLSFRDNEPIWATRFTIKESRKGEIEGTLEGKTTDASVAVELYDRLRSNPQFVEVGLPTRTEAGGNSRSRDQVVSFAINFKFVDGQ